MAKVKRPVPAPLMNAEERSGQSVSPRTAYGPHLRIRQHFAPEGRTKQSFKAECDINNIMARYQRTGVLDFVAKHQGRYADVTGLEFQSAQDLIVGAKEMFMDLPSKVRSRFQNDAGQFLEFMSDPQNTEEAIKLGLAKRRPVEATPLPTPPAGVAPAAATPIVEDAAPKEAAKPAV